MRNTKTKVALAPLLRIGRGLYRAGRAIDSGWSGGFVMADSGEGTYLTCARIASDAARSVAPRRGREMCRKRHRPLLVQSDTRKTVRPAPRRKVLEKISDPCFRLTGKTSSPQDGVWSMRKKKKNKETVGRTPRLSECAPSTTVSFARIFESPPSSSARPESR